jgi:hypothetical protein
MRLLQLLCLPTNGITKNAVEEKSEWKWMESIKIGPAVCSPHPFNIQWTKEGGLCPQSLAYFIRASNRIDDPFQT